MRKGEKGRERERKGEREGERAKGAAQTSHLLTNKSEFFSGLSLTNGHTQDRNVDEMRQKEVNRGCCWTAPPTVGWGVVDDDDAAAPTNSLPSVRLTSLCATAAENIVLYSLHPSFHPSFLRCEVGEKKKVRQAEEDNGGKRGREEGGRGNWLRILLRKNVGSHHSGKILILLLRVFSRLEGSAEENFQSLDGDGSRRRGDLSIS